MNHKQKFVAFSVSLATWLVFASQVFVYAETPAKVAIWNTSRPGLWICSPLVSAASMMCRF
jgi:hypothetical protein